ncbi:unnamed protein product [Prorocentrum cordatum]|uniref:Uncharacterized protein n=1 Tax=Prorocentrum cordatum TaxID=2364126 RepID=A0ABN9TUX6_9DINO|nr:unnamed protein product [Polarella glacialis]
MSSSISTGRSIDKINAMTPQIPANQYMGTAARSRTPCISNEKHMQALNSGPIPIPMANAQPRNILNTTSSWAGVTSREGEIKKSKPTPAPKPMPRRDTIMPQIRMKLGSWACP